MFFIAAKWQKGFAGPIFDLWHLQVFLDHRPREEVQRLVAAKTNGATPLVLSCRSDHLKLCCIGHHGSPCLTHETLGWLSLSCRNGHHEVVEYLVDRCCASVEQVFNYFLINFDLVVNINISRAGFQIFLKLFRSGCLHRYLWSRFLIFF